MVKYRDVDPSVMRLWDESKHPRDRRGRFARKFGLASIKGGTNKYGYELPKGLELEKLVRDLGLEDRPNGSPYTAEDIYAMQEKLRDIGTMGMWTDRMERVGFPGLLVSAAEDAHSIGAKLPVSIDASTGYRFYDKPGTVAFYDPYTKSVSFHPGHNLWDDPEEFVGKQYEEGLWAFPEPRGLISHEIAHRAHEYNVREAGEIRKYGARVPLSVADKVTEDVSIYAGEDSNEMVAEMFAGARHGQTYDPELWEVYNYFHGPRVK